MQITNNTILITGGSSGIGLALAAELLARDNVVIVTGRSAERLDAARRELPGLHSFVCDQSDPEAIRQLSAELERAFPALNVLINNAGIGLKRNLHDSNVPLEQLETEIGINLTGPIQMIAQFLPQLKRQPTATIVNVTSGLAFVPLALKPIYSATKAAMHSYTLSLRAQLKHTNVAVVELAPPAVRTNFNAGQEEMNADNAMDVRDFAQAAVKGLEKGDPEITPGLSRMLRMMGRLRPHMTLREDDAAHFGRTG